MVVLYSQAGCMPCKMTKKRLEMRGIPHIVKDVQHDPDALAEIAALDEGYRSTPVVAFGDQHWAGYKPERIDEIAESLVA
jgi:glutaredoxin-like protein NrdH